MAFVIAIHIRCPSFGKKRGYCKSSISPIFRFQNLPREIEAEKANIGQDALF
jgi:hypothetical protein